MGLINSCTKIVQDLEVLHHEMRTVAQAITRYQSEKGSYPQTLQALVPTYITQRDSLKWSQNLTGPEFKYTRPTNDANDAVSSAMLEYAMPFRTADDRTAPLLVRLMANGEFAPENIPEQCRRLPQTAPLAR
jgi:hypothetical protein